MSNRQETLLFCLAVAIGLPSAIWFMFWLGANMPQYALGFLSCIALWISVKIISSGGDR